MLDVSGWSQALHWVSSINQLQRLHPWDSVTDHGTPPPIRGQYSGHVISIDQSQASIQIMGQQGGAETGLFWEFWHGDNKICWQRSEMEILIRDLSEKPRSEEDRFPPDNLTLDCLIASMDRKTLIWNCFRKIFCFVINLQRLLAGPT